MAILLSGPAGAGKTQIARDLLAQLPQGVLIDFQTLYAALLGILRNADGRFPERESHRAYALAMAEYLRRAAITGALNMELDPIVSNSDGSEIRRHFLLSQLGPGAVERVIDPGVELVRERLTGPDGILSENCNQAIARWYGRL